MSDNIYQRGEYRFIPQPSKPVQWVIKYSGGLIENEKQASYLILGFVTAAIIVSLFLILSGGAKEENFPPAPDIPSGF